MLPRDINGFHSLVYVNPAVITASPFSDYESPASLHTALLISAHVPPHLLNIQKR